MNSANTNKSESQGVTKADELYNSIYMLNLRRLVSQGEVHSPHGTGGFHAQGLPPAAHSVLLRTMATAPSSSEPSSISTQHWWAYIRHP